jgi:hypothetical protein
MSAFGGKADVTPAVLERLARSNAAQWGTHNRRRNRKHSDDAVAVLRSFAAAIRALATQSCYRTRFLRKHDMVAALNAA